MVDIDGKKLACSSVRRIQRNNRGDNKVVSLKSYSWAVVYLTIFGLFRYNRLLPKIFYDSTMSTSDVVSCKYHGNCPIGTACEDGTCLPYLNASLLWPRPAPGVCIQTCLKELSVDEWHLHGSVPMVQSTHPALNGHGCVIRYERQRKEKYQAANNKTTKPPATVEAWMQGRFRRVVRVDPAGDHQWQALCDYPCETDLDCPSGTLCLGRRKSVAPPGIASAPKSCRHQSTSSTPHDMVIVTGANRGYFRGLENLASSLKFWAPHRQLVVYNLGMTKGQLQRVKSWSNLYALHWQDGIPKSYPSHVRENLKNYAWKSIIINETAHKYKSIFWLDAGATFTGPIDPIEEIIHRHGLFLVRGQDEDMKERSHPATYQWFGFRKATFQGGPHCAGGIQGHVYPSRYIDTIVIPNAKCALDPNCIAPKGSDLNNHRYDQTSLSILAYQEQVRAPHYTEYLAASKDQLNKNMSKATTREILWTARQSSRYYSDMCNLD